MSRVFLTHLSQKPILVNAYNIITSKQNEWRYPYQKCMVLVLAIWYFRFSELKWTRLWQKIRFLKTSLTLTLPCSTVLDRSKLPALLALIDKGKSFLLDRSKLGDFWIDLSKWQAIDYWQHLPISCTNSQAVDNSMNCSVFLWLNGPYLFTLLGFFFFFSQE